MNERPDNNEALELLDRYRKNYASLRREYDAIIDALTRLHRSHEPIPSLLEAFSVMIDFQGACHLVTSERRVTVRCVGKASPKEPEVEISHALMKSMRRAPTAFSDVGASPLFQTLAAKTGLPLQGSALMAPMRLDHVGGYLVFTHPDRGHFTRNDVRVVKRLLPVCSQALIYSENERLRQKEREAESQRKILEEWRRAKEAAEESAAAKTRFIGIMSHELRTPLNAIVGMADLLNESTEDEGNRLLIDSIRRNSNALHRLVTDLLEFAQMSNGSGNAASAGNIRMAPTSLDDLLNDVVEVMNPQARSKAIKLEVEVDDRCPESFMGDSGRLQQVLNNLVGNAIKFTKYGSVTLSAHTVRQSVDDSLLVFTVEDTGPGIQEVDQARIFEHFYQGEQPLSKRRGGVGLGLAISDELVKRMGGEISLISQEGEGSTFTVALPLHEVKNDRVRLRKTSATLQAPRNHSGSILVVEDNPDNQMLMQTLLGRAGYDVRLAENGKEAVDVFKHNRFSVLLMDVDMPVMDGVEATRSIRSWETENGLSPTPILMVSAHVTHEAKDTCMGAGANGFVEKPIRIDRVVETISDAIRSHGGAEPVCLTLPSLVNTGS